MKWELVIADLVCMADFLLLSTDFDLAEMEGFWFCGLEFESKIPSFAARDWRAGEQVLSSPLGNSPAARQV